jgi:protein-arginine kinase activator protein McsA
LRRLLDEAVQAEQFERAASLRDELTRLDQFKYGLSETGESGADHGED